MEKPSNTTNYCKETTQNKVSDVTANQNKWTNLPKDILLNLLKHIDFKIDLPKLRAVCPSWRSSLPLSEIPTLPSRLPVPSLDVVKSGLPLLLIESRFYLISPLHDPTSPWLTRMTDKGPGKWHLLNPFNTLNFFVSKPTVVGGISLLDCNVVEIARPFCLFAVSRGKYETVSKKVVGGWNFESCYVFAVLVQLEVPCRSGEGGLVIMRLDDQEWVRIEGTFDDGESNSKYRITDIAYYNAKFYVFDLVMWKVGVIDPEKSSISLEFMIGPDVLGDPVDDMYTVSIDGCSYTVSDVYLVPCEGHLYLVILSKNVGSTKVTLFVFVLEEGKWERVTRLGDEVLFIGYDVSFGVSKLSNWKAGSICLFTRPFPLFYDECSSVAQGMPECLKSVMFPEYYRYLKMYNMEEEEKGIVGFEELLPKEHYTGLFFPPPAWVNWRCPSLDNVEVNLHNVQFTDYDTTDGEESEDDDCNRDRNAN